MTTTTYAPYTARQCPNCNEWLPSKPVKREGRFVDGTEPADHFAAEHPEYVDAATIGIPYFRWNESEVDI